MLPAPQVALLLVLAVPWIETRSNEGTENTLNPSVDGYRQRRKRETGRMALAL